ncbi:MAG TPA: AI-2E family transporter [Chitinophagaceae bacterium]
MQTPASLYRALTRAIAYAAGLVVLLWLLYKTATALLLFLFAMVLAIVVNSAVVWLQKKGLRRGWACAVIFGSILLVLVLLSWLIVPKVSEQVRLLVTNLPVYADQLAQNVSSWFEDYPAMSQKIRQEGMELSQWLPSVGQALTRIGNYSLSVISGLIVFILFLSIVVYSVVNPRPLVQIYFSLFRPARRDKAQRALVNTSNMLVGWMRSDLIAGSIEAVTTTIFLTFMNVPGAWVWGALALFAELIPRIGFYIMSIPPILVALSVSPMTALWVMVYFIALDEIMADFVLPRLRSTTMRIHPVSILFIFLLMSSAFGLIGAIMAAPVTAIIKAYYEEFYTSRADKLMEQRIDGVLFREEELENREQGLGPDSYRDRD